MRKPVFLFLCLLAAGRAAAQDLEGPGSLPIEINSTGQTTYENGLAISPWQTANLGNEFQTYNLVWRVPSMRADPNADQLLIEPGIPGDGTAADIQSIRIDWMNSSAERLAKLRSKGYSSTALKPICSRMRALSGAGVSRKTGFSGLKTVRGFGIIAERKAASFALSADAGL